MSDIWMINPALVNALISSLYSVLCLPWPHNSYYYSVILICRLSSPKSFVSFWLLWYFHHVTCTYIYSCLSLIMAFLLHLFAKFFDAVFRIHFYASFILSFYRPPVWLLYGDRPPPWWPSSRVYAASSSGGRQNRQAGGPQRETQVPSDGRTRTHHHLV